MVMNITGPTGLEDRFCHLEDALGLDAYNFSHFRSEHGLRDVRKTLRSEGIAPGALAPDFELPRTDGGSVRLSRLLDKPVLLHFGSFT